VKEILDKNNLTFIRLVGAGIVSLVFLTAIRLMRSIIYASAGSGQQAATFSEKDSTAVMNM